MKFGWCNLTKTLILSFLLLTCQAAGQISKDSLLAYYTFESNGRDTSGRGYHLTAVNTPAYIAGRVGNGVDLVSAEEDYFTQADFRIDTSKSLTIGMWYKRDDGGSSNGSLASQLNDSWTVGWNLAYSNQSYHYSMRHMGTTVEYATGTWWNNQNWIFVLGWYDAAKDSVYISLNNGTPFGNAAVTETDMGTAPMEIGSARVQSGVMDGMIDETFIFKRVLTADERTWLYNSGTGRSWNEWTATPPPPMVTPWVFRLPLRSYTLYDTVQADVDDAMSGPTAEDLKWGDNYLYFGDISGTERQMGFRFQTVIPQGATIDSAFVYFYCGSVADWADGDSAYWGIYDVDTASVFNEAHTHDLKQHETAYSSEVGFKSMAVNNTVWVKSPNLALLLTPIVGRVGWGNVCGFYIRPIIDASTEYLVVNDYSTSAGANAAFIKVVYRH